MPASSELLAVNIEGNANTAEEVLKDIPPRNKCQRRFEFSMRCYVLLKSYLLQYFVNQMSILEYGEWWSSWNP